jgi:hypothetical protein
MEFKQCLLFISPLSTIFSHGLCAVSASLCACYFIILTCQLSSVPEIATDLSGFEMAVPQVTPIPPVQRLFSDRQHSSSPDCAF